MTIREARKSLGWTQRKLSEEFGIPLRTIENWEGGKNKCPEWAERLIVEKLEGELEMKTQSNVYKIYYKNGNTLVAKALSMVLEGGKLYQVCKAYPFDNPIPSVIDGSKIERVELIEKNNDIE